MASRKKQDEKNLKALRELGTIVQNKYCFECNQRGPTYVDVTIGSFICTKCSGMLRGITPPHRVKSISMATFTTEEVDLLRSRGNEYCRSVWMGLYEGSEPTRSSGEQTIRNFIIDKYERKRYYLEPGVIKQEPKPVVDAKPPKMNGNIAGPPNGIQRDRHANVNGAMSRTRPEARPVNHNAFLADFDKADIFGAANNNKAQFKEETGFANFDDNPVFDNASNNAISATKGKEDEFSIFDIDFTNFGPVFNQVLLFPRCNTNRWSMPAPGELNKFVGPPFNVNSAMQAVQDKYAALKDLDNEMKSQTALDWSSSGSNGSLYSSPTPTGAGSVYSSPSPQSSVFGSPSQGQCLNAFGSSQENVTVSNPFGNGNSPWTNAAMSGNQQTVFNPFRDQQKSNGFSSAFHPVFPNNSVSMNGTNGVASPWSANPFKVNSNSSNPFL